MIGVLREDGGESLTQPPQPTLADLAALVEESRAAGMRVTARIELGDAAPPAAVGRTAYRIAQEGLTNARKRARQGAAVTLTVRAPDGDLEVEVRSLAPVAVAAAAPLPGAGTGLIGLAERISLAGGTLEHGVDPDGAFVLRGSLPTMIRVLLVDDDALVRSGLRIMLAGAANLDVVAEAADGREVLGAVDLHRPDVVLMDIRMPEERRNRCHPPARRAARPARRPRAHDLRRRRSRPARAAGRRGRLPAQGHPAGGDRPRDGARPRRRRHALSHGHTPAHLHGGRGRRRRPRRASPRPAGDAQPTRAGMSPSPSAGARPTPRSPRRCTSPSPRSRPTSPASSTSSTSTTRVQIALLVQAAGEH